MSKYTTELRHICESFNKYNDVGYDDVEAIIANSLQHIFSFNFPIFDENYRSVLETKIIKHFYTREIGEETYGLWKLRLNTRLNEIMPYYNALYETELLEFNPLYTKFITTEGNKKNQGNSTDSNTHEDYTTKTDDLHNKRTDNTKSVTEGSTDATNLYSDTPQGTIDNIDVVNNAYLTNATINKGNDNETTTNTGTVDSETNGTQKTDQQGKYKLDRVFKDTNDYVETVKGYDGTSASKLVAEFREILINIDLMIINELNDLFMNIW